MALTVLLLVPFVAAIWLLGTGDQVTARTANRVGIGASALTAIAAIWAVVADAEINRAWVPSLGIRWHFLVDGISAPLVLLTALIGLLVAVHVAAHPPAGGSAATLNGSLALVQGGALATFTAADAVLFFVAFEIVLVPMWVLITRFGDSHDDAARREAGARFVLFTVLGSTLMLLGILLLVIRAGTSDLVALPAAAAVLPHGTQVLIAALLVAGLGVKVPLVPVHTWLPPAHTTAPTVGSVVLAAILLKMGTYGLVRLPIGSVPDGFAVVAPWLAVLGVIGIIWGGLVCLVERDLKRLIAYSSIAHMGFVALGLGTGSATGLQAALYANIAHGVISALLFFVVGALKQRWGSADLTTARAALREVQPRLGFALILGLAAGLGLPGLAGFWGEFLAIVATWQHGALHAGGGWRALAIAAAVGSALAAAYALRVARIVWVGDAVTPESRGGARADADPTERSISGLLVVAVVLLGVLPGPLLALMSPAVQAVIAR